MLAGVSAGVLALALAVHYYANKNTNLDGSTPANNAKGNTSPDGMGSLLSRVIVVTLCLIVVVIRIVIPLTAIRRVRDPFGAAEPAGRRILVVS